MALTDWRPPEGYVPAPSAVEGVVVYAPAPPPEEEVPEVFHCERCGHDTRYAPGTTHLVCEACESQQAIATAQTAQPEAGRAEFRVETLERAARGWGSARKEIVCEQCGAAVVVGADALVNACSFCFSHRVIAQGATQEALRPVAVLPFVVTDQDARSRVASWLGSGKFRPRTLPRAITTLRMHGVYLPFWVFDAQVNVAWSAEVGKRVKRGDKYVTRWEHKSGFVSMARNAELEQGVPDLDDELLAALSPWPLQTLQDYQPDYLAGWQARGATVPLEDAWELARTRWRREGQDAGRRDVGSSRVRNFTADITYTQERWRYVLLPVHVGQYEHHGERFSVMVNGHTAELTGRRPFDGGAYLKFAGLMLAPGLLSAAVELGARRLQGYGLSFMIGDFALNPLDLGIGWLFFALLYLTNRFTKLKNQIGEGQ